MAKPTARTGTAPFAHLLSLVTGAKAGKGRAEDEREDETEAEEEDDSESPDAEDEKPEDSADDEKPSEDAEDGDDKKEGKRARRAKSAEKDDDEEAEDKAECDDDDEDMAQARREGFEAAQARGRRIFNAASAGMRPDMAAHLAFNDTMPSAQAVAMLDMAANGTATVASGSRLGRRMARVVLPNPGASDGGRQPKEMSFGEMAKAAAQKAGIL